MDELDGQLSFWDMQIRGVEAGARAADFLAELLPKIGVPGARIHFVGHSFGSLVVSNAVRHLAVDPELRRGLETPPDGEARAAAAGGEPPRRKIHTLCLL